MKRNALIFLTIIFSFAVIIWFSCNPFTGNPNTITQKFNAFDELNSTRLSISCTLDINGSTYDLGGATLTQSGLGDGTQSESQSPMVRITNGSFKNGTLGAPCADGMHFKGGTASITSINVPDIGEDIVSVKAPGTYTVSSCTFNNGEDKCFQINDLCTITETSVNVNGCGKFMRQNGGKTWKMTSYCSGCNIQNMKECIFRSDSSSSTFFYRSLTTNCSVIGYSGTKVATY